VLEEQRQHCGRLPVGACNNYQPLVVIMPRSRNPRSRNPRISATTEAKKGKVVTSPGQDCHQHQNEQSACLPNHDILSVAPRMANASDRDINKMLADLDAKSDCEGGTSPDFNGEASPECTGETEPETGYHGLNKKLAVVADQQSESRVHHDLDKRLAILDHQSDSEGETELDAEVLNVAKKQAQKMLSNAKLSNSNNISNGTAKSSDCDLDKMLADLDGKSESLSEQVDLDEGSTTSPIKVPVDLKEPAGTKTRDSKPKRPSKRKSPLKKKKTAKKTTAKKRRQN
jgi:hypothetical protein